jgi:CheY-like chemotaxis protein
MTNPTICVEAFSRNGKRIIATVVAHMKSSKYQFVMYDESRNIAPQIAIVDHSDREMRDHLAAAVLRNPNLKVVYLVTEAGQSPSQTQEVVGTHLVSKLVPTLERVAATAPAAPVPAPLPAPVAVSVSVRIPAAVLTPVPAPLAIAIAAPLAVPPSAPVQIATAAAKQLPAPANDTKVVQLVPNVPRRERLRALVVDDSPTVRTQLANTLERMGMDCDAVDGGAAAFASLDARTYNLIFVDVVMPDIDGYKLTREIKRNKTHRSTPVIILTSKSSPFDRARGALAGCDTFLTKPVELKRLFEATVTCLMKGMAISDLNGLIRDPSAPTPQNPQTSQLNGAVAVQNQNKLALN